ncbi:MAG: alpha/beta fold hydrolase [Umezawaea sp.]
MDTRLQFFGTDETDARLTLVCLPFCGGGTGPFRAWVDLLPDGVALAALCYPGREGRFLEPFPRDWRELVDDSERTLEALADRPHVLFGHSMGGWLAFDLAARAERRGDKAARGLVVSSCTPPGLGVTARDLVPSQQADDRQLLEWMREHGFMPPHVWDNPPLQDMAVELMRADITVRDSFTGTEGAVLEMPVEVLSGGEDHTMSPDAEQRWRSLASGDFRHQVLPGGHFYTPEVWKGLPSHLGSFAL